MNARRKFLVLALPVVLLCTTARRILADGEAQDFEKITLQQIMGRGWNDFERTFAALSADPRNDQAFGEMSVVISEAGALNKIAPYLEQIVKQRPDDAAMRTILGRVYKDLIRDPVRAKEQFDAVLQRDPDDFFCHYQLAEMLGRQGDKTFDQATAHYQAAAQKIPRQYADLRTRILKELGEHLYSRRQANDQYAQEAFAAWDAMTGGMRRFDLATYEELAAVYRAHSLWQKVQETYERYFAVLRENKDAPDNVTRCRLETAVAEACENQGLYAPAVAAYTQAMALLDENTWQRRKLESQVRLCREKLNQTAAYEGELKKAVADDVNSVPARQSLARFLVQGGRLEEAAQVLEAARQLAPRNVPVLNSLESVYRKSGNDAALAGVLRSRIELSPEDFGAYSDLAEVYVRGNRTAEAEKVLSELESSPSQLPEKFLVLARAYARYGLAKRAFVLYQRLVDGGQATAEQRFEFCDFCLAHEEFAQEAAVQVQRLCQEGALEASGYVRLSEVFGEHGKKDEALNMLVRGLSACGKRPDGTENKEAVFTLNMALSDLEHRMGAGHHAQAIGSTLKALLAAPDLHFKRALNDRLITLLTNYGDREKLLYTSAEEAGDPHLFGGPHGAGIAPWVDFLNSQANSRDDADLWMLLGQIHETVEVDVDLPAKPAAAGAAATPRHIRTDLAQARLCYQKVVDMEFQNLDAHQALARILADPAVDEYEKAVNELEVISLLNPVTRWESLQGIGDLYALAGETAKAREKWQAVAEQSASEPDLLEQVAMRLFGAGDLPAALEYAKQTRTLNPYVFRNHVTYANLLHLASAQAPGGELLSQYAQEMAESRRLAQASPEFADFVPALTRGLFDAQVALAQHDFAGGDFKAAQEQYEAAAGTMKDVRPGDAPLLVNAQVQIARCVEALGDPREALRRYEEVLKDQPETPCWISTGVRASGASFLAMKRGGQLVDGPVAAPAKAAIPPVAARFLSAADAHDLIRAALAGSNGQLYLEGALRRYRTQSAPPTVVKLAERTAALDQGPAMMTAAGDGRAVFLHAGETQAIELESGKILWTLGADSAKDTERFGKVQDVKNTDQVVVLGRKKGYQAVRMETGQVLWERPGTPLGFFVGPQMAALLMEKSPGEREWQTLELETGRILAAKSVSGSTLWHPPVLAGAAGHETLLLTDSLEGTIYGFDARTGQEQFTMALGYALLGPPVVAGDSAFVHRMRKGTVQVVALDLHRLAIRDPVALRSGEKIIGGLAQPPLLWKGRLLYFDPQTLAALAFCPQTGAVQPLQLSADDPGTDAFRARFQWCLGGDTLCRISSLGQVKMWRLTAGQ